MLMKVYQSHQAARQFKMIFNADLNDYINKPLMILSGGDIFLDVVKFEQDMLCSKPEYDYDNMSVKEGLEKLYSPQAAALIELLLQLTIITI